MNFFLFENIFFYIAGGSPDEDFIACAFNKCLSNLNEKRVLLKVILLLYYF